MANTGQPRIIRFGSFEVDPAAGELWKDGDKIRIQQQPFQILITLLERPGEVVTREDLRGKLWAADTFVDFDHGLNAAIRRLRDALGDSAETPIFVETVARRGYRFIAPVNQKSVATGATIVAAPEQRWPSFLLPLLTMTFGAALVIALLVWAPWRHASPGTNVIERKLTTNSSENSVTSAVVSPDGKLLAYADSTGMYVKEIGTGEIHQLRLPKDFAFNVHVDDWFPDGSHLLFTREEPVRKQSLWTIPVLGGLPRQLASNGEAGSVSRDGRYIAFHRFDSGQQEWVMRSDGTDPVKVAGDEGSAFGAPTWSPDSNRIAYWKFGFLYNASLGKGSVEINEWRKANAQTLFSDPQLGLGLYWLGDGRLIYSRWDANNRQDAGLWVVSLLPGGKISSPKRIGGGHGWISQITASSDGKTLTLLRGNNVASAYVATLAPDGTHVVGKRRLTLDENENDPFAWTPDSKAVLLSSDRNGTMEVFRQGVDQTMAENLMTSAEQLLQPQVTPDGSEILYISAPKYPAAQRESSIFAIPIAGGVPRLVLKDVNIWNLQCARQPATLCMYSTSKGNTMQTFRFDVRSGKISDPPQVDPLCNWGLSPDGSVRAMLSNPKGTIRLRPTFTGESNDVPVRGGYELGSLDWAPDGKSLFVAGRSHEGQSVLLRITLDGRTSVLLRSDNSEILAAIPSPDGRFLAIPEAKGSNNVWAVENF